MFVLPYVYALLGQYTEYLVDQTRHLRTSLWPLGVTD